MSKFKGQITLGNGMIMVMDFNALAEFEELTGKKAFETIENMEKGGASVKDLRAFYYACLIRHNSEITIEDAGDILGEFPEALTDVLMAASPEPEKPTATGTSKKKIITKP